MRHPTIYITPRQPKGGAAKVVQLPWGCRGLVVFMILIFTCTLIACSDDTVDISKNIKTISTSDVDFSLYARQYPEANYDALAAAADSEYAWAGKSIAIMGGSVASNVEGNVCKKLYIQLLHCSPIVTYGRGGMGYSTAPYSMQDFLPLLSKHDIYILWSSTNDYGTGVPVGEPTDYTEADTLNEEHAATQCGGINKCIHTIRETFPDALIIGFTSLPFFGEDAARVDGYSLVTTMDNGQGINFAHYVQKQEETFQRAGVPYFDQFECGLFDSDNYSSFYLSDGFHLNKDGYFLVGCKQVEFFLKLIDGL
ncbi:MAG: SGNH/GDSL hydrolase family protein [Prevotellaceae bacterium]|nr:SGNH/GDSL hydrolase family protein [Prevotellaceae bacterium]